MTSTATLNALAPATCGLEPKRSSTPTLRERVGRTTCGPNMGALARWVVRAKAGPSFMPSNPLCLLWPGLDEHKAVNRDSGKPLSHSKSGYTTEQLCATTEHPGIKTSCGVLGKSAQIPLGKVLPAAVLPT